MSSSNSPRTICLPAHILDANISPRSREVLMLLASETTSDKPTLWVCHAAIAERLRCSPVTIKRSIQKLVEAKLIVETGDLLERRFKFYTVRWDLNEKNVAAQKKREKVVLPAKTGIQSKGSEEWMAVPSQGTLYAGMTKKALKPAPAVAPKPTEYVPPPSSHPGVDHALMLKDSNIAYWAEVVRKTHEENLRQYKMFLLSNPECATEEERLTLT